MSLTQLRTFIEVYRRRSLSEAGRVLDLTQPAVSQQIAALEAQLSRPLFMRHARGVIPTGIADDLAAAIGASLDTAESALAAVRARSMQLSGTVHIAAPSDYLSDFLAPRLGMLVDAGLDLRLHIGGQDALYDLLATDRVHLGFTASRRDDPRLAFLAVGEERLQAVAAPDIAAQIASLGIEAGLRAVPHLAYDLDRPLLRNWLSANGLAVDAMPGVTAPDLRALRNMVCAGIGWSVLPDYVTQEQRSNGSLVEIEAPKGLPSNRFYMAWARSALRHPRVAYAREMLLKALGITDGAVSDRS